MIGSKAIKSDNCLYTLLTSLTNNGYLFVDEWYQISTSSIIGMKSGFVYPWPISYSELLSDFWLALGRKISYVFSSDGSHIYVPIADFSFSASQLQAYIVSMMQDPVYSGTCTTLVNDDFMLQIQYGLIYVYSKNPVAVQPALSLSQLQKMF